MATGMISGGLGQFLANPMDLVKVRLQMEGKRMLEGHQPRWVWSGGRGNLLDRVMEWLALVTDRGIEGVVRWEGLLYMYRGMWDASGGRVWSGGSGLSCQPRPYRYRGMWNAYISIWNEEGLRGLWKGWQPAVQRSALVCLGGNHSDCNHSDYNYSDCNYSYHTITPPTGLNFLFIDLATYDYVKQMLLRNTDLKDNALTHSISR